MGIKVALHHRTRYSYETAVSLGPQLIQLSPTPHCRTPVTEYSLQVEPVGHTVSWQFDALANHVARVVIPEKTKDFEFEVRLVADLSPYNPLNFCLDADYEMYPFRYASELGQDLEPYRSVEHSKPLVRDFLETVRREPQPTVSFLSDLNRRVCKEIAYTVRLEHGVQSSEQTLAQRSGSCRDSAWLLVQLLRDLGLAARFVSGYLIQLTSDEEMSASSTPKPDSADLHAWAEVFLPGAGWLGMDATSGLFTTEGHIPLACATAPPQAAPVRGTVEPAAVEFHYEINVRRCSDEIRFSAPYRPEEWTRVRDLAHVVDHDLEAMDVRLTTGGEPTFVGVDEVESPEWNIEALGPRKRARGLALLRSLRERTAPGALLHLGQGKWYPGEPLPRWAFHCLSRKDGVPVWDDGELFVREDQQYEFTEIDALNWLDALTRRLQVSAGNILPAYNPQNLAEGDQNTSKPGGYVLPLRRRQPAGKLAWSSQLWFPFPPRLVLSPGDSPIGYRIPVSALPWIAPDVLSYEREEVSSSADSGRVKLPTYPLRRMDLFASEPAPDPLPAVSDKAEAALELIRPALCVEVREGRLHVFLPYTPVIADFLDLVAAVEDTCAYLKMPVWIEGYTPPADPRVRAFSLTPDPGVLEVNLPPAKHWDELEQMSAVLSEEAHRHRLIAGKFGYDGSHLATGGGSHIVLGGETVPDSPILRRPDLLRSMLSFWQNHPALSYLFSGMYVGPTSQYPRVDEARTDALYELELAFSHLPGSDCPPDILDGLFRNLLVDVSGNTHRAEFCIDKLYPPEGAGLRLGLLELRAFEMAPHHQMGLLEMLLIRSLVCTFWNKPFEGGLIRWGTALHDRFMLPHFVKHDFADVLQHLRDAGYLFDPSWFAPHEEFRFPKIGSIVSDEVELEFRQALEPWNVLAEETSSGGSGRSVDSSLERMQVKLTGCTSESKYMIFCNGRRVPLHPTEKPGEAVAGIRYRARRLSALLHPTIPLHTPLTFDLVNLWKRRAVARCTYFAGPPDGTVPVTRPGDVAEARERRLQRFQLSDPSQEPLDLPEYEKSSVFPMTLDLRWPAPTKNGPSRVEGSIA